MANGEAAYAARVRVAVQSPEQIAQQVGPAGTFVLHPDPVPVGALVEVQFVDAEGRVLSRIACRVKPTPPEVAHVGPGLALEVVSLDRVAQAVLKQVTAHSDRGAAKPQAEHLDSFFDNAEQGPIVGIDLGTTNSCVAVVDGGEPRVIKSPEGYETIPSVVYITPDKKVIVGHRAVEKMTLDPERAIYGSKRFIGRPYTEGEVKTYGHFFRYGLAADRRGRIAARLGDLVVSLEVVAAAVLSHMRAMAESELGRPVKRAVVTVPAYFGEPQRQAVYQAGIIAGLEVERILNEPTAGAVAYGYGKGLSSTILVYDLGGGTFDASVLRVRGDKMEVLATDGGPFLGGSDFDDRLTVHMVTLIEKQHGVDLSDDAVAMQRVRSAAEKAKQELSEVASATVELPYLVSNESGQLSVTLTLERDYLESLTEDLVNRTLIIVQSVLDRAGVASADLDEVIMIGGQSRSPMIRRMLSERFGKQPTRKVHPDQAVALGAALVAAARYTNPEMVLTDVLPASIRLGKADGTTEVLLARGQPLPSMADVEVAAGADGAFQVALYRGEKDAAAENEPLGSIRLPQTASSSDARALVTLVVNPQGLLSVSAEHPDTGEEEELEVSLLDGQVAPRGPGDGGEYLDL